MDQNLENSNGVNRKKRSGLVGGLIMILIGVVTMINQYLPFDFGMLILPALGLIFLVAAFVTANRGLLIPGGILSGIGAGAMLTTWINLPEPQSGGVFLLTFAGGWFLITLLSLLMNGLSGKLGEMMWWPLIPGIVMLIVSVPLLIGGEALKWLEYLGNGWPVFLIIAGLFIIFRRKDQ